jgi:recombinational DNA repair protein (RecF pathway)
MSISVDGLTSVKLVNLSNPSNPFIFSQIAPSHLMKSFGFGLEITHCLHRAYTQLTHTSPRQGVFEVFVCCV